MDNPQRSLLSLEGITKLFPGVVALENVGFQIEPGEVVALLGENGAGKSTLMNVIGGIYQPDAGEILIDGEVRRFSSVNDSIKSGIGFIHQELNMLDNLDVAANVFLGRERFIGGVLRPLRLIDRKKMNQDTTVHLDRVGLDIAPDTMLSRLSIGQKQMVEIAKALSLDARLIIMDEPTSSLTLTETETLLGVVSELKKQGVSVIYITHRLNEVAGICDRAVVLRDGKNAGGLGRSELTHEKIVQMMVGRSLKHSYQPPETSFDQTIFEAKGLRTRRYPQSPVSFSVKRGEILGIAGLVGAGRSELAQTVFGVDEKLGGEIFINKQILKGGVVSEAIDKGVYLIPEDRRNSGLLTDFSIRENITLPAMQKFSSKSLVSHSKEKAASEELCRTLKIKTTTVETTVKNLSGGNQQKVVLAKWLQLDPKVLIFDEPTRGIDIGAKAEIYELMRDLASKGVGIIVISSDMEEILGLSDRIAVMSEGNITGILERSECTEQNVMHLAVLGSKKKVAQAI